MNMLMILINVALILNFSSCFSDSFSLSKTEEFSVNVSYLNALSSAILKDVKILLRDYEVRLFEDSILFRFS